MKKFLLLAATAAAAAAAVPGTASAATCAALTCTFLPGDEEFIVGGDTVEPITGVVTATIGRIVPLGTFTDTYFFIVDANGSGSGSISTSLSGTSTDINFQSVTINGTVVPILGAGTAVEFAGLSGVPIFNGLENRLVITGTSAGQGSYGGNLTFTPTATPGAVPEPATWAMMLMGFGAVGFGMRRRRKDVARVRFAF